MYVKKPYESYLINKVTILLNTRKKYCFSHTLDSKMIKIIYYYYTRSACK